jgi:16S rRNA G966 N2-methylase RsmD
MMTEARGLLAKLFPQRYLQDRSRVRVIATAKGRQFVEAVPGEGTGRITDHAAKSRSLTSREVTYGRHPLDLFGGTGGWGLEALSRGAERVVLFERAAKPSWSSAAT